MFICLWIIYVYKYICYLYAYEVRPASDTAVPCHAGWSCLGRCLGDRWPSGWRHGNLGKPPQLQIIYQGKIFKKMVMFMDFS